MTITYLGKQYTTRIDYTELSDEQYIELLEQLKDRPSKSSVESFFKNISNNMKDFNEYYFKDLMYDTELHHSKYSVNELFSNKQLLSIPYSHYINNPKYCADNLSLYQKVFTLIRLKGKGLVGLPYQFPVNSVIDILTRYNVNNNYYDISCGWGSRLLGAMSLNINYFGTDPNHILCERLEQVVEDYKEINRTCKSQTEIYCQGSEMYIPDLENKIGVVFTSPPYFNLEDYKHGEQSYKMGVDYSQWLVNYLYRTFENCYKYLIDGGTMLINIKDFSKYSLEQDTIRLAERAGFTYECNEVLRVSERQDNVNSDENVLVFRKGFNKLPIIKTVNELF